jgi:GT2 family glycosyltransferase
MGNGTRLPATPGEHAAPPAPPLADVGCVVIGRNEAQHLRDCLETVLRDCGRVVYVDSGSTDGSVAIARGAGAAVHELDPARPFSAARARNEGLDRLLELHLAVTFVQFVDGDCCLEPGWLAAAAAALRHDGALAVVAGRGREASRASSPFKLLCDVELDWLSATPDACGGVAMMRVGAVLAAGGYDATLAAGEEPELCLRLQRAGWRVGCLPLPMMRHESELHTFGQWWRRSARAGRAYVESWWKHRGGSEHYRRREVARILAWGAAVPAATLAACAAWGPAALGLLGVYAVPALRAHSWARRRGHAHRLCALYAASCVVGKFAELAGGLRSAVRLFCGARRGATTRTA